MAVVAGLMARLEAETAGFHARLTAASAQVERMGRSGIVARRGVMLVQGGLQQLAFAATGLPGPLGRASVGLLALFGGGGPVLVAVAALGALALAFDRAGKKAEEFVKQGERLRDLQMLHGRGLAGIAAGLPVTPLEELTNLANLAKNIRNQMAALAPNTRSVAAQLGGLDPVAKRASEEIKALAAALERVQRAMQPLRERISLERLQKRLADIGLGVFNQLNLRPVPIPPDTLRDFATEVGNRFNLPFADIGRASAGIDRAHINPEMLMMSLLGLVGSARGGAGGVLAGLGGVLGAIPGFGVAGGIVGALGGVLGGIFGSGGDEERRHRELMEEARRIRQNTEIRREPQRITLVINGREFALAAAEDILYEIGRMERRDATPRLPRG